MSSRRWLCGVLDRRVEAAACKDLARTKAIVDGVGVRYQRQPLFGVCPLWLAAVGAPVLLDDRLWDPTP